VSTPAFRVIQPGLHTTVQDLGRVGSQRLGIPVSGALDPLALRAANVVVGNAQTTAGLEIAVLGPLLEVATSSARVAVAGDGARLTVQRPDGSSREVAALESIRLIEGDRLRVSASTVGSVAYLAIEGGLALPPFLGSLATYVRGGFGGLEGRALFVTRSKAARNSVSPASIWHQPPRSASFSDLRTITFRPRRSQTSFRRPMP
jgi:allophanate hydrolase subunit 2